MSQEPEHSSEVVHEVDGIQELDNKLPRWWLMTFYGAIAFGLGYFFYYDILDGEPTARSFRREMAARMEARGESAPVTAAMLEDLSHDSAKMGEAAGIFASTCATCHAANGGGLVGPNLTDDHWIHGRGPEQIFATVRDGVVAKGMPAWGAQLGESQVALVSAYVLALSGTNVAGGKAPEGEK